jgi:rhamnosyltransferase
MLASIIILTKNPGPIFKRVIQAVLGQKVHYDFEVLVIDSGSKDDTLQYLANLKDSRIQVYQIEPNDFGHGKTRNYAVSLAKGKYCLMLTHDACPVGSDWLAAMVAAAERDEKIAGVFGRHLAYESASPFTKYELELHFNGFMRQPLIQLEDKERYQTDQGYKQFLHFFSDNNALIRRSVWEKMPYPNVAFAEDQRWAKDIIEAGYKKAFSNEGAVFHSHDYSLWERLQRSFDEAYAFRKDFGYLICPSLRRAIRSFLSLVKRDALFMLEKKLWMSHPMACLRSYPDNFMRIAGCYLGTYGNSIPQFLRNKLSRDRSVFIGAHSAS